MHGKALLILFLCGSVASSAMAAPDSTQTDPPDVQFPEVLIEAPRAISTVGGASAVEVDVDSMVVPPAATVEQVVREMPMLHVRTNSRGEAEISARGSESRQVAVLVDGIPITLAWDARADLSVIPSTAIQSVEFTRGLSSMLYGPNVLGGIVEAKLSRASFEGASPALQVTTGVNNVGAHGTTATTTIPFRGGSGQWLFRGGLGFRNSPGQPLAAEVTEPLPDDDDLRLNTDADDFDGFLALKHITDGGAWLSLSGTSFSAERGIAAELGVDEPRFWRYPHVSRTLAVASAGTGMRGSPFGGRGDVEMSLGYDVGRTDIDSYTSRTYEEIDSFENGKDRTQTLRLLADQTLGYQGDLRGAFTLANIRHEESVPDGKYVYRQRLWSAGAENVWRLIENGESVHSLALSVGGAYDVGETPETGGRMPGQPRLDDWGGRVGLSAGLGGGKTVLHTSLSRRARFPSLRELYSGSLDRFAPNPELKPENLVTTEVGVTRHKGSAEFQAVVFYNRVKDAVVRITLEDRRFMRVNQNELNCVGLELLASRTLGPVLLSGNLTLQDPELTDTEADQTHRPENLPKAFGGVAAGFPLVYGVQGGAEVDYTGSQYCIDPNTGEDAQLDDGTIAGGYLSRVWALTSSGPGFSKLETRLAVENVADATLYDQFGLPQPGRRVRFELRLF